MFRDTVERDYKKYMIDTHCAPEGWVTRVYACDYTGRLESWTPLMDVKHASADEAVAAHSDYVRSYEPPAPVGI